IYRRFGKTELRMPVISAGFMRCMQDWRDMGLDRVDPAGQANLEAIVRYALERGINHLETAHAYGSSERQLGAVLAKLRRDTIIVQTKVQPSADPDKFTSDFCKSLDRLQLQRVDLLALHGLNDHRALWYACRRKGCLAAARKLQDKGLIGHIGFSGHGPTDVILDAVRHLEDGGFDYMNIHWYYIFQQHAAALEEAAARDMGVFIISPTDKGGMLQKPPAKLRHLCHPFSPMEFNDLYCLGRPEIHTISLGASHPHDFEEHVAALDFFEQAGPVINDIDRSCREAMKSITGHSRPDALWAKLPDWNRTPGYINIPFILWLYNLARGWGLEEFGRRRYQKLGQDVKWVQGNNARDVRQYDLGRVARQADLDPEDLERLLGEAHAMLSNPIS
ncbi:MAG: aldo/keto reductase, partial [Desulfobulbales bacterium]